MNPLHRIQQQPDVVERTMRAAILRDGPLFRVVRLVKNGPLCPSAIMMLVCLHEPGEPTNDMQGTRSPHLIGYLSGEPVPHDQLARLYASGKAGSGRITRAQYASMVAEIASNRRHGRYDPRAEPYKPVDVTQMEIPFARTA